MSQLSVRLLEQPGGMAKFDLTVDIREVEDRLSVRIEYNTDLFAVDTIERMLDHYHTLLVAIVDNPEQTIDDLPLLTADERQLLQSWNDTTRDYPRQASVPELFERQAAATPAATALLSPQGEVTYTELNGQANQIARYLQKRGVDPEQFVTVCLERSPQMIAVLLGILKAGGAYVPLEPDYPHERLAYMMHDTQSPLLLTDSRLRQRLPDSSAQVVLLDGEAERIAQESRENLAPAATAHNLAYVMYTSGSTGQPKGVAVSHRGIVRLVQETNFASLTADETFLHFAPISFDASTLEIWGPLLNGGQLALMPPHKAGLAELGRALQQYRVTTLWLTAGLFHQMVEDHLEALAGVQQLLAGGDVLSPQHVKKALWAAEGQTLINGYGPTENTTFTCCHPLQDADKIESSVPIGQPIANTQVHILDDNLQPVPIGVPGELYTGGDGLARGYLNHPRTTAEKFIPDPFGSEPGQRLYKTGDQARWRSDGTIVFLGRNDNQVKIRGFRVELGEVEVVLNQHPAIENVTVVARDDAVGSKQLVAYFAPRQTPPPTLGALRRFLRQRVPDYMVPSSFIMLDALPLSANGKVDRSTLPAPERASPDVGQHFVAPRDEVEEQLTAIWSELLRRDRIGVHDNFFDLGGHSLLATRIMSRIEAAFSAQLPLHIIFETPTIAEVAQAIRQQLAAPATEAEGEDRIRPVASGSEERLLSRLDEMSEEQVDSLLELMLTETE
jgi:amino acid adenylation domain-containing protein